jgi:hypothetical protein
MWFGSLEAGWEENRPTRPMGVLCTVRATDSRGEARTGLGEKVSGDNGTRGSHRDRTGDKPERSPCSCRQLLFSAHGKRSLPSCADGRCARLHRVLVVSLTAGVRDLAGVSPWSSQNQHSSRNHLRLRVRMRWGLRDARQPKPAVSSLSARYPSSTRLPSSTSLSVHLPSPSNNLKKPR